MKSLMCAAALAVAASLFAETPPAPPLADLAKAAAADFAAPATKAGSMPC